MRSNLLKYRVGDIVLLRILVKHNHKQGFVRTIVDKDARDYKVEYFHLGEKYSYWVGSTTMDNQVKNILVSRKMI